MTKTIDDVAIENISKVLGDFITGTKITVMFQRLGLINLDDNRDHISTKWRRINESVTIACRRLRSSKPLFQVIEYIAQPQFFVDHLENWNNLKNQVNGCLLFYGFKLTDNGQVVETAPVSSVTEAQKRLKGFDTRLRELDIHPLVYKFCREELLSENYFHAIFEASKGVLNRIRDLSGLKLDGNQLVLTAFNLKNPILLLKSNYLSNQEEKDEYFAASALLKTVVYMYRNPEAHTLKLYDPRNINDAITAFVLMSKAHQILDSAYAAHG